MGDHRLQTAKLNLVQRVVHRRRDRILIELHKQEIALVDTKLPAIFAQRREIFRVEVKIAPGGDSQPVANLGLQLVSNTAHLREIEIVFVVGVRRRHDVRNSVGNRRFGHGYRFFHGGGPVIEARQNMTVQIDHSRESSLAPQSAECLQCSEYEQHSRKNLAHSLRLYFPRQHSAHDTA